MTALLSEKAYLEGKLFGTTKLTPAQLAVYAQLYSEVIEDIRSAS